MSRTYVVTGSASGIGAATSELLRAAGHRVIGVDLHDADVCANLADPAGREQLATDVARHADALDGVVACAGVGGGQNPPELVIPVNYFGAVATLAGLRPLLAAGADARAVVVSSIALLGGRDELVELLLAGDEQAAVAACEGDGRAAYAATKRAIARWAIAAAVSDAWAGAEIALNVVAPGMVMSPLSAYYLSTPEQRAEVLRSSPQPFKGVGDAIDVARLIAWLASPENAFVTGQAIFADGGYQAVASGGALPRSSGGGLF